MYNRDNYMTPLLGTFFCLVAIYFLLFYSDLAVLIYIMILVDIQHSKSQLTGGQGPWVGDIKLNNPFLSLLFYLDFIQGKVQFPSAVAVHWTWMADVHCLPGSWKHRYKFIVYPSLFYSYLYLTTLFCLMSVYC